MARLSGFLQDRYLHGHRAAHVGANARSIGAGICCSSGKGWPRSWDSALDHASVVLDCRRLLLSAGPIRGAGIGRKLIEHVYAKAAEAECSRVWWLTHETNTPTRCSDMTASRTGRGLCSTGKCRAELPRYAAINKYRTRVASLPVRCPPPTPTSAARAPCTGSNRLP